VIESVELEPDGRGGEALIAQVRPKAWMASRCSCCDRRAPGYDTSSEPRRWRGLHLGTTQVILQARTRRVVCPTHGVVVAAAPWARPGLRFTAALEDTVAWLVCHATLSVVAVLLRIAWRSVSGIVTRVVAERAGAVDRLAGLRRVGVDLLPEGQRYLLVITDHDTGRLVWAEKNRTAVTLGRFFDDLGAERAAALTRVSADGAEWIHTVVAQRAPHAVLCLDGFHVVAWATKALDEVRRGLAAGLRRDGRGEEAASIKGTRWALLKNPDSLTVDQRSTLAGIQATNGPLYRAYLLKDQLRAIFSARDLAAATKLLIGWLAWELRCRLEPFVKLAKTIKRYRKLILRRRCPQPVQCPFRGHQHTFTAAHPPHLRLRRPRSADRHGRSHPRRPLPTPPGRS